MGTDKRPHLAAPNATSAQLSRELSALVELLAEDLKNWVCFWSCCESPAGIFLHTLKTSGKLGKAHVSQKGTLETKLSCLEMAPYVLGKALNT